MRFFLLSIACFWVSIIVNAQNVPLGFNGENNNNPLYVFLEDEDPTERYLLEKDKIISPDNFIDNPLGMSLANFKSINLKDTKNNCSFFKMQEGQMPVALGIALYQTPELSFLEDRLYKVKFHLDQAQVSKTTAIRKLSKKFGKSQKNNYKLDNNASIKEYLWEGYKINISLLFFEENGQEESVIIIEDELVGKLAIADQENKTFVKEAKLYSDIETLMRYK